MNLKEQAWYKITESDGSSCGKVGFLQSLGATITSLMLGFLIFAVFSGAGQGGIIVLFDWLAAILWFCPLYLFHGKFVSAMIARRGLNLFANLCVAIVIVGAVSTILFLGLEMGTEGVLYGIHNGLMYGSLYATTIWTKLTRREKSTGQINPARKFSVKLHWISTVSALATWCFFAFGGFAALKEHLARAAEIRETKQTMLMSLPISVSFDLAKCKETAPLYVEWKGIEAVVDRTSFGLLDLSRLRFGIRGYNKQDCNTRPRLWCDPKALPVRATKDSFYRLRAISGGGRRSFCAEVPPLAAGATDRVVEDNRPNSLIWVTRGALR